MPNALDQLYNGFDRFRHRTAAWFGKDLELDEISDRLTRIKDELYRDGRLQEGDAEKIQQQNQLVLDAYRELLEKRGFDLSSVRPTTQESFRLFGELQQIHFQHLAGKHLRGGDLAELSNAASAHDRDALRTHAQTVAFELLTSPSREIAIDKLRLLRAALSRIPERADQLAAIVEVRKALTTEIGAWRSSRLPNIDAATFDAHTSFKSVVATYATPLPASVRGNNQLFPNRPLGEEWEATTRTAVASGLDDMSRQGQLFIDKIPNDGKVKNVALKLDLNLGADGPPSVSDPATTGATVLELLQRADRKGKKIALTVGDSAGGENIPIGRTTMDILRDTGNYHMALKAGLTFAASKGSREATDALKLITACEEKKVYFGSKDDRVNGKAERARVEAACAEYVRAVDYDREGYVSVDPQLGPLGLAAWGTREFQIAKPWVEADYRVHVTRGLSNHFVAKWTGALKGLIGLHAFGLRPADQTMDKRGDDPIKLLRLVASGSIFSIFETRTGLRDVAARVLGSGDVDLQRAHELLAAKWDNLRGNVAAWAIFRRETGALADELDRDKQNGASQVEISDKMRWRTREILERAEAEGNAPGFMQGLWDAIHEASRIALRTGWSFRGLLPENSRDAEVGQRIGLLTSLPYSSDLVIQCQPKIGRDGGPDSYRRVLDTGFISVGIDEASVDAVAWNRAKVAEHMWNDNWPLYFAQQYARAPMHLDEITRFGNLTA